MMCIWSFIGRMFYPLELDNWDIQKFTWISTVPNSFDTSDIEKVINAIKPINTDQYEDDVYQQMLFKYERSSNSSNEDYMNIFLKCEYKNNSNKPDIFEQILTTGELPAIINKANIAYLTSVRLFKDTDIRDILSDQFICTTKKQERE